MKPKTVCPCGNRLTGIQIARGNQFCCVKCNGKYRKLAPVERGFNFEVPTDKRRRMVGPGFRAFIDGEIRPVPKEGVK